jgi:hypothetical protein
MQTLNPANKEAKVAAERKRVPMSVPVQQLEAPEIPGYHLHWFNGTRERLQRAIDGGYEFVHEKDMKLNPVGLGSDSTHSGNTDMGSQVSRVAGSELDAEGQPIRMILMKIKQEWYDEDQKLVFNRNLKVADSLTGGMLGDAGNPGDTSHRYVDKAKTVIPDMFNPNKRKRA